MSPETNETNETTETSETSEEERALLGKYLDGLATDEELAEISRQLEREPEFAREFARISILDSRLERALGREQAAACLFEERLPADPVCSLARPEVPAPKAHRPRPTRRRSRRSLAPIWAAALAAAVLLGTLPFVLGDSGRRGADGPIARGETPLPTSTSTATGIASVVEVQGDARYVRAAGDAALEAGHEIQSGDEVRTGIGGVVGVRFADGTMLMLWERSEATVAERDGAKRVHLEAGRLVADVALQPATRQMIFVTTLAEATVLGTRLELAAAEGSSRLDVTEGVVRFTRRSDGASVEVAAGQHAIAASGVELAALGTRPAEAARIVVDHEGPLFWQQHPECAPLAFALSPLAHSGKSALRVIFEAKAGDRRKYGQILHPLVLKSGDRALRFFIRVEHYEGNADWNIQVRQRDLTCWKFGGGMFRDLSEGWNLVEIEFPQVPENAYGGGTYRPAEVQELIFSVCQRSVTCLLDDFTVVGGE